MFRFFQYPEKSASGADTAASPHYHPPSPLALPAHTAMALDGFLLLGAASCFLSCKLFLGSAQLIICVFSMSLGKISQLASESH